MCGCQETCTDFARELYDVVARNNGPENNMIISPISIQSSLMLAFVGAAGSTADELRAGLKLGPSDRQEIGRTYHQFWTQLCSYGDKLTLRAVNRLFISHKLTLQKDFEEFAVDYFQHKPQALDFANAAEATTTINNLVEEATEHKIRDLLQKDAVNAETSAVLVNVLYFKGLFRKPFMAESTINDDFYIEEQKRVAVDMMYQEDKFKYAELPELGARALELLFEDSNISLLIILPNKINGLVNVEQTLLKVELASIVQRMEMEDVDLALPKFCIEFDLDVKDTLQQMGISKLFGNEANLSRLFEDATGQKISAAKHRGYIDVNEAGCEAAAVTFLKIVPMCLNMQKKTFKVDHPFVFYILNSKAVFFAGRFAGPQEVCPVVLTPTLGPTDSMKTVCSENVLQAT